MDARKKQILHAVIQDYVDTAEPVGSRTIAKKYDLGISPATIRNEMSDLEELGYIRQPHTSAGRIPSDKGYRYYVDCLMEPQERAITQDEQALIAETFTQQVEEIDALLQESCKLLSKLTNYTAMIMKPKKLPGKLIKLNLVQVDSGHVVVVMTGDDGKVSHRILEVPPEITPENLADFEAVLQQKLIGLSLTQVTNSILKELALQMFWHQNLIKQSMQLLQTILFGGEDAGKVLVNGVLNLLNQPEFQDVGKVRDVLSALEVDDVVRQLLLSNQMTSKSGTVVYIGGELTAPGMNDCSVVSTPYYLNGEQVGSIGVLGPTRMQYPKVIALVEQVSKEVSEKMDKDAKG